MPSLIRCKAPIIKVSQGCAYNWWLLSTRPYVSVCQKKLVSLWLVLVCQVGPTCGLKKSRLEGDITTTTEMPHHQSPTTVSMVFTPASLTSHLFANLYIGSLNARNRGWHQYYRRVVTTMPTPILRLNESLVLHWWTVLSRWRSTRSHSRITPMMAWTSTSVTIYDLSPSHSIHDSDDTNKGGGDCCLNQLHNYPSSGSTRPCTKRVCGWSGRW
jgi:hypothetical protein